MRLFRCVTFESPRDTGARVCRRLLKLLTKMVIVSRSRVTARALYVTRGDKRHFRLSRSHAVHRRLARSPLLSVSLALFPFLSLAFSVLLSMKLGELGQRGKSIITKRGVMTQMLKSRSLRAKLFSVSRDTAIPSSRRRYSSVRFFVTSIGAIFEARRSREVPRSKLGLLYDRVVCRES